MLLDWTNCVLYLFTIQINNGIKLTADELASLHVNCYAANTRNNYAKRIPKTLIPHEVYAKIVKVRHG